MHRRIAHLLLMLGLVVGAYLALSAFDRAAWADGIRPSPPAPIEKPAVATGSARTSSKITERAESLSRTSGGRTLLPKRPLPKPHQPNPDPAGSDRPKAASAKPVERTPAAVRDRSTSPAAPPVRAVGVGRLPDIRQAVSPRGPAAVPVISVQPPKAGQLSLRPAPAVVPAIPVQPAEPWKPSLPLGPARMPAVTGQVTDGWLLPAAGVVEAVVGHLSEGRLLPAPIMSGAVASRLAEGWPLPAPIIVGAISGRSSVSAQCPSSVVCPPPAPQGGWQAGTPTGSSVVGIRMEARGHGGSMLRVAPAVPRSPVEPTHPGTPSAGCGQLRDSGCANAPSIGDVPSSWRPETHSAAVISPEQTNPTGRSVRYCSPPS